MTAVDTNVVVRLLTGDDPAQTAASRSLLAAGPVWIAKTVWLEADWVLRSLYGFEERAVRDAFILLLGVRNVHTEDESCLATALELAAHGVQFADAMHLSTRPKGASFVSFDKALVRRARRAGVSSISEVSAGE